MCAAVARLVDVAGRGSRSHSRSWTGRAAPSSSSAPRRATGLQRSDHRYGRHGIVCRVPLQRQYRWQCERPGEHSASGRGWLVTSTASRNRPAVSRGRFNPANVTRNRANSIRPHANPSYIAPCLHRCTPVSDSSGNDVTGPLEHNTASVSSNSSSPRGFKHSETPTGRTTTAPESRPGHRLVLHRPRRPSSRSCFFAEHMITTRSTHTPRTRRAATRNPARPRFKIKLRLRCGPGAVRVRSRATRCRPDGERLLAPDGVVAQNPRMRACRRATGAGAR